jgi:hypothetical protein
MSRRSVTCALHSSRSPTYASLVLVFACAEDVNRRHVGRLLMERKDKGKGPIVCARQMNYCLEVTLLPLSPLVRTFVMIIFFLPKPKRLLSRISFCRLGDTRDSVSSRLSARSNHS